MRVDRRWLSWTLLGAVVLGAVAWSLWPRPVHVDLAEVVSAPITVTLDEEGETRVRERFVVSAPVAGRLLRIELEPGDPVVAGETVLATFEARDPSLLDPRRRAEAEEAVRSLEAELDLARNVRASRQAELGYARRQCDRARALEGLGVLAEDRLDAAELQERRALESLNAAVHAVEGARHRLESARARLLNFGDPDRRGDAPLEIRAPIDGVVLRKLHESESVVSAGEPLLEVGDPAHLEVVSDYLSRDAVRIRPGSRAWIERWGGPGALEARVARVEPSGFTKISALGVEEKRVNVILDIEAPPEARAGLADGFRVETRVVVEECEAVPQVPAGSLFRRGDAWTVFAVEDGRAVARSVEIGVRTQDVAAIRRGLEVGDLVIVHPGDQLSDGTRVVERIPPY